MSDLVGCLRVGSDEIDEACALCWKAADEIERLRSQLEKTKVLLKEFLPAAVADDLKKRAAIFLSDGGKHEPACHG